MIGANVDKSSFITREDFAASRYDLLNGRA